ncbi:hypothetical protein NLU13_3583 [Sarocladium strictum]|uniref:Uncharacterized protein n=1 Tax=Sarocladium strictum TaxID=5046 RepID=A0AA39GMB2_SARSR|nr:hypothetical protein NLU13_3583 [Sarocladium strictum]
MSSAAKHVSKQRDPPPALFLHPSPAASHVSLPGILAPGAGSFAASSRDRNTLEPNTSRRKGSVAATNSRSSGRLQTTGSPRSADKTDARWAEMQATLEEVELSASGGTHVFGAGHDEKLEDLRKAQIALAQAWARSEADDTIAASLGGIGTSSNGEELRNLKGALGDASKSGPGDGTDAAKSTAASNSARPGSSGPGVERLGAKLEEETESDILLARKRREANDQYFQRVNNGVLDVVLKLEDVAVAMKAVERESKEVWDGEDEGELSRATSRA